MSLFSSPSLHSKSSSSSSLSCEDRFIPNRASMDLDLANFLLVSQENFPPDQRTEYSRSLARQLLNDNESRILTFQQKPILPFAVNSQLAQMKLLSTRRDVSAKKIVSRYISPTAEKILDAPEMVDDYYLNLLDWSCTNTIGVALSSAVYLWNASNGAVTKLTAPESTTQITSLNWAPDGNTLAIGTDDFQVQIWDCSKQRKLRTMRSHTNRVSCLSWNNQTLASGSRDNMIHVHDVRIKEHLLASLSSHSQEVCGLKFSGDGTQLASGGNDNKLCLWDVQSAYSNTMTPRFELSAHSSAVKALGWAPFQKNLLASGGGTQDRTIRFWNSFTGECINSIDTGSQVCSLLWAQHTRELVTSHGFSDFQLSVWKYPSLVRIADLKGHESRVLFTALSPDGKMVVSAAGDETIRFWKVFDIEPKKNLL